MDDSHHVSSHSLTFLPRDATQSTQSAVMPQYVVRPSVTFRYRDHIGWNSSKIISRPRGQYGAMGTLLKLGRNRGGVTQEHKKNLQYLRNSAR